MSMHNHLKHIILAAVLLLTASTVLPESVSALPGNDIIVLYDNDVHCAVDGYAKMAALKKRMAADNPDVILVSSGDYVQGGSLGATSKGDYIIRLMNSTGYDAVTLGNHEFDYGIPRLKELAQCLDATVTSANLFDLTDGRRMFEPFVTFNASGKRVTFIGISTPYSFASASPAYFVNDKGERIYSLCAEDLYGTIQRIIDMARTAGSDYIILLTHLGTDIESDPINSLTLIKNIDGADAVLDGHSHSTIPGETVKDKCGNDVLLTSTGSHFDNIGLLTISEDGIMSSRLIPCDSIIEMDSEVKALTDSLKSEFKNMGDRLTGTNGVLLRAKDDKGVWLVRSSETGLGDFVADAFREILGTDVSLIGGGSLRADLPAGRITFNDIYTVFPFENSSCSMEITGKELLDALEMAVSGLPSDFGGFPHLSGITMEVDASIESPVVIDINKAFVRVGEGERRVRNVKILNRVTGEMEDAVPERKYTIASTSFILRDCGDGFTMFAGHSCKDSGIIDNQLIERYITEKLSGVIPSRYGQPAGRVVILKK